MVQEVHFKRGVVPEGVRVLGVDDAPFPRVIGARVLLVGVLYRVGLGVEGIVSTRVRRDGLSATRTLLELLLSSRFKPQIDVLLLDGIAVGGFNVLDLPALQRGLDRPVMTFMRDRPDLERFHAALARVDPRGIRRRRIEVAGEIHAHGKVYFQIHGATPAEGRGILDRVTTVGLVPEPLRLAHLIGAGIERHESRGRA